MKALSDLIQQRSEELQTDISRARVMSKDDTQWLRAIDFVKNLTANYEKLVKDAIRGNEWTYVKIPFSFQHMTLIELERYLEKTKITDFGTRIIVDILENEQKQIVKVTYYAFRRPPFTDSYMREIISYVKSK